ncbi:MAG: hypothetical protein PVH31_00135 [Ectothiorhodospiraceae bacterium]|jgi:hypothetical protein
MTRIIRIAALAATALALLATMANASALEPHKAGDLALYIVMTDSPDAVANAAGGDGTLKEITPLRKVSPGESAHAAFLVTGLTAKEGKVDYSVSWRLIGPSGSQLAVKKDYAGGNADAPDRPAFLIARPQLELTFEESDAWGAYTLQAQVLDKNSGRTAQRAYKLHLVN